MMAKTFLEQARELEAMDSQHETDSDLVDDDRYLRLAELLRMKCWSEILAVVEAARKATIDWDHDENEMGQATADERICDALDALGRKAGE